VNSENIGPEQTTVAFIGLGIMGLPMARNLLGAGYSLRVYNRSRGSVDTLSGEGAVATGSPAEAADGADVIILMLPNSPDVDVVVRGNQGVMEAAGRGSILIDMSTISPVVTRELSVELAERGVRMLDAPVSGGEKGAVAGELTIMVGGEQEVFDRCVPLLEVMGGSVTLIGESGAGQVAKACNQIIVAGNIQAASEALTLARNSGVDPARVREALLGGFAGSKILEVHGQRIIDRTFEPGFKSVLHRKDLDIALEAGAAAGTSLQTTALIRELFGALIAHGDGALDHSALVKVTELLSAPPQ
jgi:2-hydroxy-3-oxopropionate reductase